MHMIEEEGGHLPVKVFLTVMGVHPDLLRRLTPCFTQEVNRRKIITIGVPIWHCMQRGLVGAVPHRSRPPAALGSLSRSSHFSIYREAQGLAVVPNDANAVCSASRGAVLQIASG
jgi:hypothetical protein